MHQRFRQLTGWAKTGRKRKRMSNTRVHPLSWLLSNNRLEKVPFVSVPHTSSNRLLLSNQDKGCTPSVARSLALPLGPALLNLWNIFEVTVYSVHSPWERDALLWGNSRIPFTGMAAISKIDPWLHTNTIRSHLCIFSAETLPNALTKSVLLSLLTQSDRNMSSASVVRNGIPGAVDIGLQGNDTDLSVDFLSEINHLLSDIVVIAETKPVHVPRSRLIQSPVDHIHKVRCLLETPLYTIENFNDGKTQWRRKH